ncbi:MAG: NADH-quinone oxidoreductase subunit NuoG [Acidobacteria bacterium]|nr:NADH-quinone oxidoreductase subunit NuoG [Acidobacteriota bacterium]
MATIFIDQRSYDVPDGMNLLDASLTLGFNLPYFCWHPALGSVGACRQCAVKQFRDEKDMRGRLVMACMTAAAPNTRISIDDPDAREFRKSVGEWLMVHHPHDCPVCDEGGECHLQDMEVMDQQTYRRYRGLKRTFRNQDLGPFVNHEMNRCIQCYRCVRFYRDYAGGRDFDAFFLRDRVFFGRQSDGVLESPFSGNLVEVCPTGVFTDKTLKLHFTRKWDERTAPSICVHCAAGCNTIAGERYGLLRRIRNRFNGEVNGYFLCDRGRYGYEFVNGPRRVRAPRIAGRADAAAPSDAVARAASPLAGGSGAIGIGSPRASLEANFALRALVGPDRFCSGMGAAEHRLVSEVLRLLQEGPAPAASLHDAAQADAVLVLGEDVTNTAPMLALALRQSVRQQPMKAAAALRIPAWDDTAVRNALQDERGPLYIATVAATPLDDVAAATMHAAPDDLARIGCAIAHALDQAAPSPRGALAADAALVGRIAGALRAAERPLVVAGVSLASQAVLDAAARVAHALHAAGRPVRIALVVPECNSLGAAMLGGCDLDDATALLWPGSPLIVLENDLPRRCGADRAARLFERAGELVVVDHTLTPTAERATIVLPAATFAEGDGTYVNGEGRAQRAFQVFVAGGDVQESWRWLRDLMRASGRGGAAAAWETLDDVTGALARELPAFAAVRDVAPPATFRIAGTRIAREPARYSGRTARDANVTVHEPEPPGDPDSALSFTMEGFQAQPPPAQPPSALIPRFWAPGWNSVQSVNYYQTVVGGPLRGGDPGLRLIEPAAPGAPAAAGRAPSAFEPDDRDWLCVPMYEIFGSEELSALAPSVAALAPRAYVALNDGDLHRAGLREGGDAVVASADGTCRLQVRRVASLPPGVAGIGVGLQGAPWMRLPDRARIHPAERDR